MTHPSPAETAVALTPWLRRLAAYQYLADLVAGKRVLEIPCGDGFGARFLAERGADSVIGVDPSADAVRDARGQHRLTNLEFRVGEPSSLELDDDAFDVVFAPGGDAVLRRRSSLEELRRVLAPDGCLIMAVTNADRPMAAGGASYYELKERLERLFSPVRLVAQAPFVGMSVVGYASDEPSMPEVSLDASLLDLAARNDDDVTDYVAVCGEPGAGLGGQFTVVQWPAIPGVEVAVERLGVERARARRDDGAARRLEKTVDRVRELEAELAERSGEAKELQQLRGRVTQLVDERVAMKERIQELERQVDDAQQETGRVAAEAGIELNEARDQVARLRARVEELEARLAGGPAAEPSDTRKTHDERTPTLLIARAMAAHAEQLRELETVLDERTAYADEQREERDAAVAEADAARSTARELEAKVAARDRELSEWRHRAATAEGELLRGQAAQPPSGSPSGPRLPGSLEPEA